MTVLEIVLGVIFIIVCCVLTVIVLAQEGKTQGLGAIQGFATDNTYWSKAKGRSKEGVLMKVTIVMAVLFIVLGIVLNLSMI
ncbi:MAG: preprotein translocase subunit SecG [Butyrivibrio sp.]|nr:preprotein translocase subunit SecG [Butyrivibrio sp.]